MLVADANAFKRFLKDNVNISNHLLGKAIKKYCDIFWDLEKRLRKYSEKEYNRAVTNLDEEYSKIWKRKIKKLDELKLLMTYFAKRQIYLYLKNK